MVVAGVWRWGAESAEDTVSGAVGGCENKTRISKRKTKTERAREKWG